MRKKNNAESTFAPSELQNNSWWCPSWNDIFCGAKVAHLSDALFVTSLLFSEETPLPVQTGIMTWSVPQNFFRETANRPFPRVLNHRESLVINGFLPRTKTNVEESASLNNGSKCLIVVIEFFYPCSNPHFWLQECWTSWLTTEKNIFCWEQLHNGIRSNLFTLLWCPLPR